MPNAQEIARSLRAEAERLTNEASHLITVAKTLDPPRRGRPPKVASA